MRFFVIAMLLFFSATSGAGYASGCSALLATDNVSSAMRKECKRICKQMKKEGWKVFHGSSTVLDKALESYYDSLAAGGSHVMQITATGIATNVNLASTKANARASQEYASRLRSEVESVTEIETKNTQEGESITSRMEVESNLTVRVEQMVKGMSPVLTLRRDIDGKTEVQMFFILKHISENTSH